MCLQMLNMIACRLQDFSTIVIRGKTHTLVLPPGWGESPESQTERGRMVGPWHLYHFFGSESSQIANVGYPHFEDA